jgi:manganese/zinc/iron transport system permease protein
MYAFISLDLLPLIAVLCTSLSCTLVGSFLVVRKQSLLGDALSHAVLPGIVISFLITSSRASPVVFLGASVAAICASAFIEALTRYAKIDAGASMGVVFSLFFALGVLLIESASARGVDLDTACLLEGQIETLFWFPPSSLGEFFSPATFAKVPSEVYLSVVTCGVVVFLFSVSFKELLLLSFDSPLGHALGLPTRVCQLLFTAAVAGVVVSSFRIVGSIIVIALLVVPSAASRIIFSTYRGYLTGSLVVSAACSILGYGLASFGPELLGASWSMSASGAIACMCGVFLAGALVYAHFRRVRETP